MTSDLSVTPAELMMMCLCLRTRGQRVSVCGQVGSLCPVLVVSGTTFFCFTLTDDRHTLPVLVKVRPTVQSRRFSAWTHGDVLFCVSAGRRQAVVVSVCVCGSECVCYSAACVCPARLERKQHPVCDRPVRNTHRLHTDTHT